MKTQLFLCRSELTATVTRKVMTYDGTLSMNIVKLYNYLQDIYFSLISKKLKCKFSVSWRISFSPLLWFSSHFLS